MDKSVSNMKAHFFNKKKAAWESAQGEGTQEQEPQGKGYRARGNWGEQSWGKPESGKGYQGIWGSWKKEEWGKTGWTTQKDKKRGDPREQEDYGGYPGDTEWPNSG
jgi:hypothetical protein